MSALPPYDATELVTKTDLLRFGAELRADLKTELDEGLKTINGDSTNYSSRGSAG